METNKNGGLALLRLVFMLMVCVFNALIVGGIERACTIHTLQYNVYYFLEAFALCAMMVLQLIMGILLISILEDMKRL